MPASNSWSAAPNSPNRVSEQAEMLFFIQRARAKFKSGCNSTIESNTPKWLSRVVPAAQPRSPHVTPDSSSGLQLHIGLSTAERQRFLDNIEAQTVIVPTRGIGQ